MARTPLFSRLTQLAGRSLAGGPNASKRRSSVASRISRRTLFGTGAGALLGCAVRSENPAEPEVDPTHRIIIVGAGLAGLTCAYFLGQRNVQAAVFEAGSQVGGRVYTLRNELPERLFSELGGEFIDSRHAALRTLAEALGIQLEPHEFAPDQRFYWVGERRVSESEIAQALGEVTPRILEALELAEESDQGIADLDATPLSRWLERNVPIHEYPQLSALLEAAFRAEFGLEIDQQTSVNLVHLFGDGAEAAFGQRTAFRAREGNDLFARRLSEKLPAGVRLNSHLRALGQQGTTYRLAFENSAGLGFVVEAERVVLAVPFTALSRVDLSTVALSGEKRALIRDLKYGHHTKVVGAFNTGTSSGARRVTGDAPFQVAWDSSPGQSATFGVLTNLLSGKAALGDGSTANAHMLRIVPELERSLVTTLKYVEGSARRLSWPNAASFRGSISSPIWGQWSRLVSAGRPEGDLHFCGEHTSVDFRGTLEGAVESGALVAAQILRDRMLPLPAALESLLLLKAGAPQPCLRDSESALPRPLARRSAVLRAHAEFVLQHFG